VERKPASQQTAALFKRYSLDERKTWGLAVNVRITLNELILSIPECFRRKAGKRFHGAKGAHGLSSGQKCDRFILISWH